jgi:cold shock CspA family protein
MSDDTRSYLGQVIWFKNTYGFIAWEKDGVPQKDLFVYYADISEEMKGYRTLFKGQQVSFQLGINKSGQPKAINVVVLKN